MKRDLDVEAMLEQLFARNAALEAMQCQIVLLLAGLTDDPKTSVQLTMADVRAILARTPVLSAGDEGLDGKRIGALALAYVDELTKRLVEAKRHRGGGGIQ